MQIEKDVSLVNRPTIVFDTIIALYKNDWQFITINWELLVCCAGDRKSNQRKQGEKARTAKHSEER